jgi:Calcineurin-like phosphoesterase
VQGGVALYKGRVRTAIVSDLHLGVTTGEDVLRDGAIRRILFEEIAGADRVVLLGDVVELRDQPIAGALAAARPFFEELGEAVGEAEVTLVPGNHDHRFAEPLLDPLSAEDGGPSGSQGERPQLGLEQQADPSPGPTAFLETWLGPARLRIAYPGVWLRDDVYATHGHYMDQHLNLPRLECIATAAVARLRGPLPIPAGPAEYERVLRPIYGLAFAAAQTRRPRPATKRDRPSEAAWEMLSGEGRGKRGRRVTGALVRAAFPAGIWALNRALRAGFDAEISGEAIFRGGVEAATEMATRLGVDGVHVITGHSHRAGPLEAEADWPLPGGGSLHNTGSWTFSTIFHHPGRPPNPYWPGTVTWLEDDRPPRRERLLLDRSHAELTELVARAP